MSNRLKGRECDFWMGTEIGMLGGYGFWGQVTAGDDSDKKCKMGAEYNILRRKEKKQQCKVGREEEGSGSNQPELAAFFLALFDKLIEELFLYLCDNQSLLKAVSRWSGAGEKATLVGAPDADILEHIELPAKLLDYFLQSNKSQINQLDVSHHLEIIT